MAPDLFKIARLVEPLDAARLVDRCSKMDGSMQQRPHGMETRPA